VEDPPRLDDLPDDPDADEGADLGDDFEEGEQWAGRGPEPLVWPQSLGALGEEAESPEVPWLVQREVLVLWVTRDGEPRCRFLEPEWFSRMGRGLPAETTSHAAALLHALARWLTLDKPAFLAAPHPATLAAGDAKRIVVERQKEGWLSNVPVLQSGLVERVRRDLRRHGHHLTVDETSLGRFMDLVWLVWDDACLPLRALFGDEYKLGWAVAACLDGVRAWRVRGPLPAPARSDPRERWDPRTASQQARLRVCASLLKLNPDDLLAAVLEEWDGRGREVPPP